MNRERVSFEHVSSVTVSSGISSDHLIQDYRLARTSDGSGFGVRCHRFFNNVFNSVFNSIFNSIFSSVFNGFFNILS
jgi:hypothetical protein